MKRVRKVDPDFSLGEVEFVKRPSRGAAPRTPGSFDPNLMNAGMYIAAPLLSAVALGYFLDTSLNTKPLFIIVFIIGGSASAFYNLYKMTKS